MPLSDIPGRNNTRTRSCWTGRQKSIKLATPSVRANSTKRTDGNCGEEVFMSTQPSLMTPSERSHSLREAPVSQQYAARFLNMHPKTVLRKAREGSLPAHPVGSDRKRWHFYLSELDDWLRSQVIAGRRGRHNIASGMASDK